MFNNVFWHILQLVIFLCPCSFFTLKIFESRLRVKKSYYWLTVICLTVFAGGIIALTMTEISPYRNFSVIGISIIMASIMTAMLCLFRHSATSILFIAFIYLNIQYNSFVLAEATLDFHKVSVIGVYENFALLIIATIYNYIMLFAAYHMLVKPYKKIIEEDMVFTNVWCLFCLPAGTFFAIRLLMYVILEYTQTATKEMLLPVVAINVCMFSAYYAVLSSITATYEATVEKGRADTIEAQLALWQQQYENLQLKINLEAQSRHDWKHHIISVMDFVDREDISGLQEYLKDYREKYLVTDGEMPVCDISALNTMFSYYKHRANELGVEITISQNSFENCHVTTSDLAVLFGNLLENAIEACKRMEKGRKYIKLKTDSSVAGMVAIICENSFDGTILEDDGEMKSCKKNGGIGLYSIKSIAEKYGGTTKKQVIKNVFKIYITLQNSPFQREKGAKKQSSNTKG